jgi:hypothetical protein
VGDSKNRHEMKLNASVGLGGSIMDLLVDSEI